jgi:basic membrane lipoprotein Med (substrate-binding protein (PBP1-ABC) superfamily)
MIHLRARTRRIATAVSAASALALLLGGCSSADDWSGSHSGLRPIGAVTQGFTDAAAPPAPGATIAPRAGTWDTVHPPQGYRVVLLTAGDDRATETVAAAVAEWATAEGVSLKTVTVTEPDRAIDGIVEAMELGPDLIVSAGAGLVDPLAVVTASHLERQFLIVGAQLPEPTANVTAAIWQGASSRGSEVADSATSNVPDAVTPEKAGTAVRAGVASVLNDITGIVVSID